VIVVGVLCFMMQVMDACNFGEGRGGFSQRTNLVEVVELVMCMMFDIPTGCCATSSGILKVSI